MKRILFLIMLISQLASGQNDSLSLARCLGAAETSHPAAAKIPLIGKQTLLKIRNLRASWYPALDLNARVSYQSDIVKIDVDLPFDADFPSPSRDQYRATVDVSQMIYDGGSVKASRRSERIGEELEKQSVLVDLYQVKEQVKEVYFGILMLTQQRKILEATAREMEKKVQQVQAAVKNGTLLTSDLKTMKAEQLQLGQNINEIVSGIRAGYDVLEELTGLQADPRTVLILPETDTAPAIDYQRPEHELFNLNVQKLEAGRQLLSTKKLPRLSAFGQFGYGKPGLNMLSDDFNTFYLVGARLTWNIWDWKSNSRERRMAEVEKQKIRIREQSFNKQLDVQMARFDADIEHYRESLKRDREIIELRRQVLVSARSKLDHGVITASDYISDLMALTRARIIYEQHKIALERTRFNQLFTSGQIL